MRNIKEQEYNIYFDGDLSRYYEYVFLCKENNEWKVVISYCTPEESSREEITVDLQIKSQEAVDNYIEKLSIIFSKYKGKSIYKFKKEIYNYIQELNTKINKEE